ncbi:MAG TPA: hypothetical protein VIM57_07370, partial [Luteolibacter sp.]
MGLDLQGIRYHCGLKKKGCVFRRVAMLGRQVFASDVEVKPLLRTARRAGLELDPVRVERWLTTPGRFVEDFYRWLGAEVVESFDVSNYEGATRLWDMNEPLPGAEAGGYDFVFDGGTLEHVFRFPDALRGALALVAPEGAFLSATPANSYLGHGFYQFGPDLPFSILHSGNGFELGGVHLVEMRHEAVFHEVLPPGAARGRALASTPWPAQMFYWGRRTGPIPERLTAVQPDYEEAWQTGSHSERGDQVAGG